MTTTTTRNAVDPATGGSISSAPVQLSARAASKALALLHDTTDEGLRLRILVRDGGYSGYDYRFALDAAVNADDLTRIDQGVALVVDAMSYQKLRGATIDYVDDANGQGFVIDNPGAPVPGACGCGGACACQG